MYGQYYFRCDGTLWDSTPVVAKAWTKVFAAETDYHMIFSPETLQALFGRTLPVIAEILMPDLPAPRRLEIIETCCEEEHRALLSCRENLLFTGVRETLRQLSRRFPLYSCQQLRSRIYRCLLSLHRPWLLLSGRPLPRRHGPWKGRKYPADDEKT